MMKLSQSIRIGDRQISHRHPVFIIAEAGVNHNGDMSVAKRLVDVAVRAGADAVKFQAFRTEQLILPDVGKAPYQRLTTDKDESQFQMLKKIELSAQQNMSLCGYCRKKGIVFLTTPFDDVSLDELDVLDLPAYKIASTDLTNLPFLRKVARKGKPVFLSTGMSYISEVEAALKEMCRHNKELLLLQCTANYPAGDEEINLRGIETFRRRFGVLTGYSDHSSGIGAGPFAVPMGARVIEKHFTLDKTQGGPDHLASLSSEELLEFVRIVRRVEKYLGTDMKEPSLSEQKTRKSLQKCLVARKDIRRGEVFSDVNVTAKRTGGRGVSPLYYRRIFGKPARRTYCANEVING